MAYGIDIDELYYTDADLVDIGILDKYEISLDLANEKDFEIKTENYNLPIGGFWYIPNTEYGGVIRGKGTNSDDEEATYTGRSWRGVLDEHVIEIPDKQDVRYLQGEIDELLNDLIAECGLDSLFVCKTPYVDSTIDTTVDLYEIGRGTTLYEAMWGATRSINLTFFFEYSDKVVYLTPILSEDYTDYMIYSSIGALSFEMTEETGVPNHYIMTSVDERNKKRTIHLFTDENGAVQPYATVDEPVQDSEYILGKSQQILTGVDEICKFFETESITNENYVLLTQTPKDWKRTFGSYYYKVVEDEQENYYPYEATESESFTLLTSKPKDWDRNYSKYFDRQIEDGEYVYRAVSANSVLDTANKKKVKEVPLDWKTDYAQYYYEHDEGLGPEYDNYSGVTKNKYTKLTSCPDDFYTDYNKYYRKVIVAGATTSGAYYVDVAKNQKGKYIAGVLDNGHIPNFRRHVFYRKDSKTVAPQFIKGKTYMIPNTEVAPAWASGTYYKQVITAIPPKYVKGNVYKMVYDHYADMVQEALGQIEENQKTKTQKVTMGDFIVNVGDVVGGRDEYTGQTIVAEITNINVEIKNGMLEAEYVIGG